jgi:hypothetical protein
MRSWVEHALIGRSLFRYLLEKLLLRDDAFSISSFDSASV